MPTIAENLQKLRDIKLSLKESINAKNAGAIDDSTPFSAYTSAIDTIQVGGGDGKIKWINGLKFSENIYDDEVPGLLEKIDFSNTTSFRGLFSNCLYLSNATYIDTSKVTDMSDMFKNCNNLNTVPLYNTSNVTNMDGMFNGCSNLKSVPTFDTSNIYSLYMTFYCCSLLREIPMLNTSKVTNMYNAFGCCGNLTNIPLLDTSNVVNMNSTFASCNGEFETVPEFDVSNVEETNYMFAYSSLKWLPKFNSVKNKNADNMFVYCNQLTKITDLDVSSVTTYSCMFDGCENLRYCMLRNLGKANYEYNFGIDLSPAVNYGVEDETNELTANARQSLIDTLITYSFDRAEANYGAEIGIHPQFYITLSETTKGLLTEEEIAQITAKGLTIA